ERVVSNDYVVWFRKRFYQLLPPMHPGERGGRVVIEERLDGSMAIRFGKHYLSYQEVTDRDTLGGLCPQPPGVYRMGGRCQQEASGTGAGEGIRSRWHTADRRALGSHSCGALSSRRRGWGQREATVPSSEESSVQKRAVTGCQPVLEGGHL